MYRIAIFAVRHSTAVRGSPLTGCRPVVPQDTHMLRQHDSHRSRVDHQSFFKEKLHVLGIQNRVKFLACRRLSHGAGGRHRARPEQAPTDRPSRSGFSVAGPRSVVDGQRPFSWPRPEPACADKAKFVKIVKIVKTDAHARDAAGTAPTTKA